LSDVVICPICHKKLKQLNNFHLRIHCITLEELLKMYPDTKTICDSTSKLRSEKNKQQMLDIHQNSDKDYLNKRYENVGKKRKEAWDNCDPVKREKIISKIVKKLIENNQNEEIKNKKYKTLSKTLKKRWNSLTEEQKQAEISKRKEGLINYFNSLTEEEKKEISENSKKNGIKYWNSLTEEEKKEISENSKKFNEIYWSKEENRKNMSTKLKNYWNSLTQEEKHSVLENGILKAYKLTKPLFAVFNDITYVFKSYPEYLIAKYLTEKNIKFQYENVLIEYIENNKKRIYITDFYLEDYNTIIEYKGYAFYNKKNMILKEKAVLEKNYKFELIFHDNNFEKLYLRLDKIISQV